MSGNRGLLSGAVFALGLRHLVPIGSANQGQKEMYLLYFYKSQMDCSRVYDHIARGCLFTVDDSLRGQVQGRNYKMIYRNFLFFFFPSAYEQIKIYPQVQKRRGGKSSDEGAGTSNKQN
ncbi:hypothetical protein DFJ77DRAFT_45940 [Powellomyces hirtus]|nr:hypothetical protein DFJ77DRAFT_45940 [Powellomyces hirtus]